MSFRTRTFRLLLGGAGVLGVAALAVAGLIGFHGSRALYDAQLEDENAILAGELEVIQSQVEDLEADIQLLADRDSEVRTLAGLERFDEEVFQVGVGGPGSPVLDDHPLFDLNPDMGARAFAVMFDVNALQRRADLLSASLSEAADSLALHRELLESTPSILPADGYMSSAFSNARLHPIYHELLPHEGIDLAAPLGTPIMATANGVVTFAGTLAGYGQAVEIDHGFGYATLYGHASRLLVTRGQTVRPGDVIAQVGQTGIATAPHVHYEVRVNERPVNPMGFVIAGAIP